MTALNTHADRVAAAVAAYAADRLMLPGGDLLVGAVREALLVARLDLPFSEIPAEADRLIEAARREQQAIEHGEAIPA